MKKIAPVLLATILLWSGCTPPEQTDAHPQESSTAEQPAQRAEEPERQPVNYIRDVADELIHRWGLESTPEDERILTAYRYLIETVYFADPVGVDIWRYRSEQAEPPDFLETRSISPLVFGVGSCEDFAAALALLLEQMGFEALYVPGYTISVEGEYVDHAWTLVRLEGEWYHLDPQLEQNIVRNETINYRYFLKSDGEMITDHKWGENLIDFWEGITEQETARIREQYTPPECVTVYPQRLPEAVTLPTRPDLTAVEAEIQAEREALGPLPEIPLNFDPPVLIGGDAGQPGVLPYAIRFLDTLQRQVYDQVLEQALSFQVPNRIPLDSGLSDEAVQQLIEYLHYDYPQLYWLDTRLDGEEGHRTLLLDSAISIDQAKARQQEIDQIAAELLAGVDGAASDKAELLHDRLAAHIRFAGDMDLPDIGNLYGGLVRQTAVCDGYTQSYQYLLSLAGVSSIPIQGSSFRGLTHSWNLVELEDGWYYVDVTWDSPTEEGKDPIRDYLAVSREEILREHVFQTGQYPSLPETGEGGLNFYRKYGFVVEETGRDLVAVLAEAFTTRLESVELSGEMGPVYLDLKVIGSKEWYGQVKEAFLDSLFPIQEGMQREIRQRGLEMQLQIEGITSCEFNDTMQMIVLYPKVSHR